MDAALILIGLLGAVVVVWIAKTPSLTEEHITELDSMAATPQPNFPLTQLNEDGTPIQSDDVLLFRRRAIAGDMYAQRMLGEAYFTGTGIMQDFNYALHWFLKAAAQNCPDAQFFIAGIHDAGHGVPKNSMLANEWYTKAAENGSHAARTVLSFRVA